MFEWLMYVVNIYLGYQLHTWFVRETKAFRDYYDLDSGGFSKYYDGGIEPPA
ncbi:hypothetical protein THIOSC13_100005 [uncultured Thiomicrorhabdus sp.]